MNQKKDIHNKVLVGLGLLFGAWFIFDLTLKIIVYGFTDYDFLWYCDFALILLAYGLFRKNNDFIVAFLASALLLQPLWMIDFAWMGLFKIPLNTLSLSSFQPGFFSCLICKLIEAHLYDSCCGICMVYSSQN